MGGKRNFDAAAGCPANSVLIQREPATGGLAIDVTRVSRVVAVTLADPGECGPPGGIEQCPPQSKEIDVLDIDAHSRTGCCHPASSDGKLLRVQHRLRCR